MNIAEWVALGSLGLLSVVDLKARKIPLLPVIILGMLAVVYRLWVGTSLFDMAAGVLPGCILLLLAMLTRESIGYGDGAVLVVLGLFCGVKQTVAAFGMALVLAALLAMILLVLKRVGRKTELPFLPCLCSGYVLCLLW